MTKSVKFLVSILLVIAMLTVCVACSSNGGNTPETKTEAESTTKPEEVTTEVPEVATTEGKAQMPTEKVKVEFDPETYEWSDSDELIFEGTISRKFYKKLLKYPEDDYDGYVILIDTYNEKGEVDSQAFMDDLAGLNSFLSIIYECNSIAETFNGKDGVIGYKDDSLSKDEEEYYDSRDLTKEQATYQNKNEKYRFFAEKNDKHVMYLEKSDPKTDEIIWKYPLNKKMALDVVYEILFNVDFEFEF